MKNYARLDEMEVVVLAQKGDAMAMEFLLNRYAGLLGHICDKYYLKDGDRDDLLQEARIGFVQAVKDFADNSGKSFKNFAFLCVQRELDSCVKRSNRKKHAILNDAVSFSGNYDEESASDDALLLEVIEQKDMVTPESVFVEKENLTEMQSILKGILSKLEYRVLLMRLQGYSYNEITLLLQLETKSVDNAMQRIRKKVKREDLRFGF